MNWADYCILGALGLSVLMGSWRGFISEMLALTIWVAAVWLAWLFGPRLAEYFQLIDVPSARLVIGYALCFIAALIGGSIVRFFMRTLIQSSGLTDTDRVLGMLFGLARGVVLVTLIVLLLGFTPLPRDPWWRASHLLPSFELGAQWAASHLPAELSQYLMRAHDLLAPPAAPTPTPAPPESPGKVAA